MPNQGAGPIAMTPFSEVVFLFDVDNTLLDNDRVQDDLRNYLEREFGAETRDRYRGSPRTKSPEPLRELYPRVVSPETCSSLFSVAAPPSSSPAGRPDNSAEKGPRLRGTRTVVVNKDNARPQRKQLRVRYSPDTAYLLQR